MSVFLGIKEKRVLGIEATKAWKNLRELDLIEMDDIAGDSESAKAKSWRHQMCKSEVGVASFCDMEHKHFRKALAVFLAFQGRTLEAFDMEMNTGKAPMAKTEEDTVEARECAFALLKADITAHRAWVDEMPSGERKWIHTGYVTAVARNKFRKPNITFEEIPHRLSVTQIEQLHYTIRNRIAATEGRGNPKSRNTSQRRRTKRRR